MVTADFSPYGSKEDQDERHRRKIQALSVGRRIACSSIMLIGLSLPIATGI